MPPRFASALQLFPLVPLLFTGACGESSNDSSPDAGNTCTVTYYADLDGDGFGDDRNSMVACEAPDGYVEQGGDCDDSEADAFPGSLEVCDGLDNDCDGLTDSADPDIDLATERDYFPDEDGDGFGADFNSVTSCDQPNGYVPDDTDCDDGEANVNPSAAEVCDGFDNNCNDLADDEDAGLDVSTATAYYLDADGDGYGVGSQVLACEAPSQHATVDGDCDDASDAANPGASEVCDTLDNDCDGGVDGTPVAPNQCTAFLGGFSGDYAIRAQEKIGNTVINDMRCNGTMSLTVDLSADPAVQGIVSCSRVGGLIIFDETQTGTILGEIDLDGTITATLRHQVNEDVARNYNFTSAVSGDFVDITGSGSVLPHPMSAVAWEVTYSASTER